MTRLIVLAVLILSPFLEGEEKANQEKARLACESILTACEAYQTSPQNEKGKPPTILLELVKPPFGGVSFLRNGEKDLLDPWGKTLQYAVAKDEKGELRAYVWAERTIDGKTKVIGTKPPEQKKK